MPLKSNKLFFIKLVSFQLICTLFVLSGSCFIGRFIEFFKYHNKIYKNVYINHIDLSGKTKEEAQTFIETHVINTVLDKELSLNFNEVSIQLPIQDFFISSNLSAVLSDALAYSNGLTLLDKWHLLSSKQIKNFDLHLQFDEEAIISSAEDFITTLYVAPADAQIAIDPEGQFTTVNDIQGRSIDITQLSTRIADILEDNILYTLISDSSTPKESSIDTLNKSIDIDLNQMLKVTNPNVTAADLQQIDTIVSSYSTSIVPTAANATNITLAAQAINNTLLMPGDVFSFNDLVGNTTLEKGYVYAPVIANSQLTQGVGGGVCQVSSTLYNAVLSLGLTPLERRPHSKPSSYVPLGLDATIDWGNIDFKFENTLEYPLYISAFTKGSQLEVKLYSNHSLLTTSYELSSEVLKVIPSGTKFIKDSSLPSGSKELVSSGNNGYQVKVVRDTYKNGQLVENSTISLDTYPSSPAIYRVG